MPEAIRQLCASPTWLVGPVHCWLPHTVPSRPVIAAQAVTTPRCTQRNDGTRACGCRHHAGRNPSDGGDPFQCASNGLTVRPHTHPHHALRRSQNQKIPGGHATAIGSLDLILRDAQPSLFGTGQHAIRGRTQPSMPIHSSPGWQRQGDELHLPQELGRSHDHESAVYTPPRAQKELDDWRTGARRLLDSTPALTNSGPCHLHFDEFAGHLKHASGPRLRRTCFQLHRLGSCKSKAGRNVLALVLPHGGRIRRGLVAQPVGSWLAREYRDMTFVTIAAIGDTGRVILVGHWTIGEALVIATRRDQSIGRRPTNQKLDVQPT